jgi:hypothetical protein
MRLSLFEKIIQSYNNKNIVFTDDEILHKERIEKILEIKLKNISFPDIDLYKKIKEIYPEISYHNFCKDINYVERIIANQIDPTGDPHKVFIRYIITEVTKKSIEIARNRGDAYSMAYAANILGKHNQTDKEDNVKPPFDMIVPVSFEITSDPRVIGIEPIADLEIKKKALAEKYGIKLSKLGFIEEAKIIKTDGTDEK